MKNENFSESLPNANITQPKNKIKYKCVKVFFCIKVFSGYYLMEKKDSREERN